MTRARELGKLANRNTLTADNTNNFVGIGSTQPDARLDVDGTVLVGTAITLGGASGIVSATSFYGDGSNLDGVASAGLGTALAEEGAGSVIYYTDSVLGIGSTVVVDPPSSTRVAYTQYTDVSLDENVDLIVAEGDDFVPDVLGISTAGITTMTGVGGRIRAGTFTNKAGTGAPQLTFGAEIPVGYGLTGAGGINVGGAATISGNLTVGGVLTYDDVTNVDSLGIITARSNVSIADSIIHTGDTDTSIRFPSAGTFTVSTNGSEAIRVDSSQRFFVNQTSNVGSTAKLEVTGTLLNTNPEYSYPIMSVDDAAYDSSSGPGGGIGFAFKYTNGGAYAQAGGIRGFKENTTDNNYDASMAFYTRANGSAPTEKLRITSTGGVHFSNAELIERVSIVANKLSAVPNVSLDNGMVHYYTTNETTTATPNIISTAGINTNMATGDTMSVTILSKPNNAGYFPKISIDGVATGITTYWSGGSAPSSAESSGVDVNVYQIIKTADATYDVLANTSNFA
jgi:hypothetical protein